MSKNNTKSSALRDKGNEYYLNKRFIEALLKYNESLLFAVPGSENISLAYGNRSACYFNLAEYQHCLNNIKLAIDNDYPASRMSSLDQRDKKCRELMEKSEKDMSDDPMHFFKLTYPCNPEIPFMSNCLELKRNDKYGRYIVTNHDLNPGDIITVSEPFFKIIDRSARLHSCTYCATNSILFDLIPCPGCVEAMYCSVTCLEADRKELHRFVCGVLNAPHDQLTNFALLRMLFKMLSLFDGDIKKLREFLGANRDDLTVFDFDFRNTDDRANQKNMMLATLSKKNAKETWSDGFITMYNNCQLLIQSHPTLKKMWIENSTFLNRMLRRLYFTIGESKRFFSTSKYHINVDVERPCNIEIDNSAANLQRIFPGVQNHTLFQNHVMTAVDGFNNLLNHSCVQNVLTQNVGNKNALVVILPIKKGEQIFTNYEGSMLVTSMHLRQQHLLDLYGFKCDCFGCVHNFPTHENFEDKEINSIIVTSRPAIALRKEAVTFYTRCDLIKQNFHLFPCKKLYYFIAECILLLSRIAQTAPMVR